MEEVMLMWGRGCRKYVRLIQFCHASKTALKKLVLQTSLTTMPCLTAFVKNKEPKPHAKNTAASCPGGWGGQLPCSEGGFGVGASPGPGRG